MVSHLYPFRARKKNHQPDVQWQSDLKDTVYLKVSPKRARSYGKVFYLNAHVMVEIKYLNLPAIIKSQRRSEEKNRRILFSLHFECIHVLVYSHRTNYSKTIKVNDSFPLRFHSLHFRAVVSIPVMWKKSTLILFKWINRLMWPVGSSIGTDFQRTETMPRWSLIKYANLLILA